MGFYGISWDFASIGINYLDPMSSQGYRSIQLRTGTKLAPDERGISRRPTDTGVLTTF